MVTGQLGDPRLPARFWAKVRLAESGCWEWQGAHHPGGYARFYWDGYSAPGHRVAYEVLTGTPVPDGAECDHLCRNTRCVNPGHIDPVSHLENVRRGSAVKEKCPAGHEYGPRDVRTTPRGLKSHRCSRCHADRESARGKSQRAAARAARGESPPVPFPGDEVARMWRLGMTTPEIASALGRNECTVKSGLQRLRSERGEVEIPRRRGVK